jgi:hypothetical protein
MRCMPSSIAPRIAHVLFALASLVLLRGSSCVMVVCNEYDCDPCVMQCKCSTCPQSAFVDSHRLAAFELLESTAPDGSARRVCAWIDGLSVARANPGAEAGARELREFAEGVLGVNHELLDLESGLGHWRFSAVELAGEFALVAFTRVDAAGAPAEGSLAFLFDARGKLLEIDRTLP